MTPDDLMPDVAEAFGLGAAQAPATPAVVPAPRLATVTPIRPLTPAAPTKKKAAPRKVTKTEARDPRRKRVARSEEIDVVVRESPHRDLKNQVGFLTIDYKGETPDWVTFDPFDERKKNAVVPVQGWLRSEGRVVVTDERGRRWAFAMVEEPDEYEAEEDDEEDDG